jgi:hypothetical protein
MGIERFCIIVYLGDAISKLLLVFTQYIKEYFSFFSKSYKYVNKS